MKYSQVAVLFVYGFLLTLAASTAFAAEPAVINFMAPTVYTDGSPIAAGTQISYAIYQGLKGGTKGKVATITETTATVTSGLVPGNSYCFEVTAIIAGQESARSQEKCKEIAALVPQAVVITVR